MKKFAFMFVAALLTATFVSCSDSDDAKPAIGITGVTVTPEGSPKSYNCIIDQATLTIENTNDSVDWDVIDATLKKTIVKATATIGGTVYVGTEAIGADGIEVDATSSITLTVKDEIGQVVSYTLKVVKATTASGDDMIKKSSMLSGMPSGIVDYDVTVFNDKFYAFVTSVSGENENYQLFTSDNGLNWTEVEYKTDATGVTLPEGQTEYVIGGEGTRLQVFNGKLYVLGGSRTLGKDKYGNEANIESGWFGPTPFIPGWRSFSTSDGETFKCDTIGGKLTYANGYETTVYNNMRYTFVSTAVLGNKLFIKSGYSYSFGMCQGARAYQYTTNGKDWTGVATTSDDEECDVTTRTADAFFTFKNKLWSIGGFKSFLNADFMCKKIYSSADGVEWKLEGESTAMPNLYNAKVIATDDVVLMFGGETFDGENRELSNKIFRSTDGVNWEEIAAPAGFDARRNSAGAAMGNAAWLFGGFNTTTAGNYAYPFGDADVKMTDTWVKLIK
ncbi:MAG: hypothetical protein ACI4B3_08755 [Prevotella sp.]